MNHCLKKLYYNLKKKLWILSALSLIYVNQLQAMEPQYLDTDTNKLIFKLLTLKAEYLGDDLHNQIEKIKPLVYATVTEEKIRQFIDWVPTINSDEYKALPYNLDCEICFDKENKISCLDLLLASSYFPKEYETPTLLYKWNGYMTEYAHKQLAYAYQYQHRRAYIFLQNAASYFLKYSNIEEYPEFYKQDFSYDPDIQKKKYERIAVNLKLKNIFVDERIIKFASKDEMRAYFESIAERARKL